MNPLTSLLPTDTLGGAGSSSSASGASQVRQRASAACLQCRRLKSKCKRDPDPTQPCQRCKALGTQCEVVKSRRGRVLGSRNKQSNVDESLAHVDAALHRIKEDRGEHAYGGGAESSSGIRKRPRFRSASYSSQGDPRAHGDHTRRPDGRSNSTSLDGMDDQAALNELPLESRMSPDLEHGTHDHPLSLLSDVGSALRREELPAPRHAMASGTQTPRGHPGWSWPQLQQAAAKRSVYFRHRPGTVKRDVAKVLDPISRRMLSKEQAEVLVREFFTMLQPQVGFMDPRLHTLENLRARSALLETAILATAAQAQDAVGAKELSEALYKHAEGLLITIVSRNTKSPEIVLALLTLSLWPRCPDRIVDDRSRTLLALAVNMALELGMNRERACPDGDEMAQRWQRDRTRTWITCVIQDKSLSAFSGKSSMISGNLDLAAMNQWLQHPYSTAGDRMLVGFLELRTLEQEARDAIKSAPKPYMVDSVRVSSGVVLDGWVAHWVTDEITAASPLAASMMRILAGHVHLLITSSAADAQHSTLVTVATSSLAFVLNELGKDARYICRTICSMITWAAVLLLRLDGENSVPLVRDVALSMAPYGDGRFDTSYAHFYGSFLLSLCFDTDPKQDSHLSTAPPTQQRALPPELRVAPIEPPARPTTHHPANPVPLPVALPPRPPRPPPEPSLTSDTAATATSSAGPSSSTPNANADPVNLFLGLDTGFDFALPWDGPQTYASDPSDAVSPPLEWLFNDWAGVSGGMQNRLAGDALWGFGPGPSGGVN